MLRRGPTLCFCWPCSHLPFCGFGGIFWGGGNSHMDTFSWMPAARVLCLALGSSQEPKGCLFFSFLWELIPVASRVSNRTVSLGFLGLTPGNLAWPCCAFGQGPSLSPGVSVSPSVRQGWTPALAGHRAGRIRKHAVLLERAKRQPEWRQVGSRASRLPGEAQLGQRAVPTRGSGQPSKPAAWAGGSRLRDSQWQLGPPTGLASGTSSVRISAKGDAGQLPSFCRGGARGSQPVSTQLREGKARWQAMLLRFLGPLHSLPWGPQRWGAWGSRDGSSHRSQLEHLEEGSALSQPWGPWTQTGNCPILNAPESTVHSFTHPSI